MGTSTEELNTDIARTRAELSQDVDALQDKVSPSAIMERRKTALRDRWSSAKSKVMGSSQSAFQDTTRGTTQGISNATSNAGSAIENRVDGSPLAAGLVAFGAGLVVAGLIPASKAEAQGAQRLKDAAQEHGQPIMDQAKTAAQEVGDQLKDKATEAADQIKSSAQQSADRVRQEAPTGSSGDGLSSDDPSYRPPGSAL